MALEPKDPLFFATPAEFRAWLEAHHAARDELWVGYWKKATGKRSIAWAESVEQALCFGWIDGIRKSLDGESYANRFTPRRSGSHWSARNLASMERLMAAGLVHPAGIAAWEARDPKRTAQASYERDDPGFEEEQVKRFRANEKAWTYFEGEAPYYRKMATLWVVSAKRAETRERRLAQLIADSAAGLRIKQMRR